MFNLSTPLHRERLGFSWLPLGDRLSKTLFSLVEPSGGRPPPLFVFVERNWLGSRVCVMLSTSWSVKSFSLPPSRIDDFPGPLHFSLFRESFLFSKSVFSFLTDADLETLELQLGQSDYRSGWLLRVRHFCDATFPPFFGRQPDQVLHLAQLPRGLHFGGARPRSRGGLLLGNVLELMLFLPSRGSALMRNLAL